MENKSNLDWKQILGIIISAIILILEVAFGIQIIDFNGKQKQIVQKVDNLEQTIELQNKLLEIEE